MNDLHRIDKLYKEYLSTDNHYSYVTLLKGEYGVGKSFCIDNFFKQNNIDIACVITIDAISFNDSSYSTLNCAVYNHIKEINIESEIGKKLLQKAAAIIPRFGHFISDAIDNDLYVNSINQIVKRVGINTEEPNLLSLINFIEGLSSKRPVILYCKNIQWFDTKSWNTILQILTLAADKKWFSVLTYTTNARSSIISTSDIDRVMSRFSIVNNKSYFNLINKEKYDNISISNLIDSILKSKSSFSKEQYDLIYIYTKGLPLFVKLILEEFIQQGYITLENDQWITNVDWGKDDIINVLKDSVNDKINNG